jgi:hypothetical protein
MSEELALEEAMDLSQEKFRDDEENNTILHHWLHTRSGSFRLQFQRICSDVNVQ